MMGFFCILQSISPHAYKCLRNSGYLNIPHPRTLRKICTSLKTNPQTEQSNENFLAYMKKKVNILKSVDKTVILMLDEIHLKPYLDFKGGNILGITYNSEQAATSAYVFMIQSLLSPFKEVVHIMPVKKIDGEKLFAVVKKTIVELDSIGFKVIGVVSDNNSINRKAMSNFSVPPKLSIVYPHPSDSSNPLFFVIDSVHIFKCIRNNWINKKNAGQCFYFPDFEDHNKFPLLEANFSTLKQLYDIEMTSQIRGQALYLGGVDGTRYCNEILLPYVRLFRCIMGLQFLFMDDNAPCHRTVAAEQLFREQTLGSSYLTTSNDSGASIGAVRRMGSNASTTH
ncbi:transposable element P transposase [Trichonephila clavipes]|nr:transposable element P transposase [Trichonephila clavipes]